MPKTVACLWFDGQAEQAAAHYTAIFPNSEVVGVSRYGPGNHGLEGSAMVVNFSLDGQPYVALNRLFAFEGVAAGASRPG